MKRLLHLSLIVGLFLFNLHSGIKAQTKQGQPLLAEELAKMNGSQPLKSRANIASTVSNKTFNMDSITFWVGSGTKRAAMAIQWKTVDGTVIPPLVWGYKWTDDADGTGIAMLTAILKADPRLYALIMGGTQYGSAIGGLGYDADQKGELGLLKDNAVYYPSDGIVSTSAYDFDDWTAVDANDYWYSGWYTGFLTYMIRADYTAEFSSSGLGASSRQLADGCWDMWVANPGFDWITDASISATFKAAPQSMNYSKGTFIVNEDWFGHNNSTVNFLDGDGNWHYRVFQTENPGHELGATSQFGTIYGGKMYIVSKQAKDGGATIQGSRLSVSNARTMKVINEIADFDANADGRSFLGVDENTGYIGTNSGIYIYDIPSGTVTGKVTGTASSGGLYNGQIGNMMRVGDRVFAIQQSTGILVINPNTQTVETTIAGDYGSIVLSKDGNLWISTDENANAGKTLVKLNPYTLASTDFTLPDEAAIPNSWYAWTADGFCAGNVTNSLYWKNNGGWFASTKIYKLDASNPTSAPTVIFDSSDGEWGIYGAGFRIDPVTDEIYVSMYKSFGDPTYKVVKLSSDGTVLDEYPMEDNYWFPAMPVFPDNYAPVIDLGSTKVSFKGKKSIYLGDKVTDKDNFDAAIVKSVTVANSDILTATIQNDSLKLTGKVASGSTTLTLRANSNGKIVTSIITANVIDAPSITSQPADQDVVVDEKSTFSVEAAGGDLAYQWYKNGTAISGATSSSYSINKSALTDNGAVFYCQVFNDLGTVTSNTATLTTELIVPQITAQATASVTKAEKSGTVRFSVTARGGNISYQWYKDDVAISSATSYSYSISSSKLLKAVSGVYYCVVTNAMGNATSDKATLTVLTKAAITSQPVSQTVESGSAATLSLVATGDNLAYQWYKKVSGTGTAIAEAANSSYTINAASDADAGIYYCVVSNAVSSAQSNDVTLTVSVATDIDQSSIAQTVLVYPNPFADYIIVNTDMEMQAILINLSGKTLISAKLTAGSNRINTSALPAGVYLLKTGSKTVKLVK